MCPRPEIGILDINDIKRIIKEFADIGGKTIKPFWRGEPTADKRMLEILTYCKELELTTMLNTNGSFVYNNLTDILKVTDWISFSIDEDHDNINDESLNNVFLAKNYCDYVEVQSGKYNKQQDKVYDYMGVPYIVDTFTKRKESDNDSEVIAGDRKYCNFPEWRMIISYDGSATLCCVDWDMDNKIGNVFDNSLEEMFYGDKATKLRKELKEGCHKSDICRECPSKGAYV